MASSTPAPPVPPSNTGATLKIEFAWIIPSQDDPGGARSVVLTGKQVSALPDSRFVSCFGWDRRAPKCQYVSQFRQIAPATPEFEFDGSENVINAQPGVWVVAVAGDFGAGAVAEQTCAVNVDSNRDVTTVKITLGEGPSCLVQ